MCLRQLAGQPPTLSDGGTDLETAPWRVPPVIPAWRVGRVWPVVRVVRSIRIVRVVWGVVRVSIVGLVRPVMLVVRARLVSLERPHRNAGGTATQTATQGDRTARPDTWVSDRNQPGVDTVSESTHSSQIPEKRTGFTSGTGMASATGMTGSTSGHSGAGFTSGASPTGGCPTPGVHSG